MEPDSFSLQLCEKNAAAEGVKNASFQRGNAVNMGYERVELIDTTDGSFMTPKEAGRLMLRGSTLLLGIK